MKTYTLLAVVKVLAKKKLKARKKMLHGLDTHKR
jgi:hypothetical protein